MALQKGLLVSFAEKKVEYILKKYEKHIKVFPKVNFFNVFSQETSCSKKEYDYLAKTHFDFVICEPEKPYKPLFAIEFDGIQQSDREKDPLHKLKKEIKTKICKQDNFPLLWITYGYINNIDNETVLDIILDSYIHGKYFENLREQGQIDYDETYLYEFKPLHKLLNKYRPYLGSIRGDLYTKNIAEVVEFGGKIKYLGIVELYTEQGLQTINNYVQMEYIDFPHFASIEFLEDYAKYLCMKEIDVGVKTGKYKLNKRELL